MNFYSVSVSKSLSVLFILGASLVLCSQASTLNELDDGEFVEMKPPLESAVDYYDKFYTSFNRFTRDVPLLHFRRNYATETDNEDSQEIEHSREKRQVKFVDNDSPSSSSSPSRSPSSSGKRNFETESNAATLAFGPASLTVSAGNAKHYPGGGFGGYPILGGGGYYPGGGYPGGGYPGGGYPGGGYGDGAATATATATAHAGGLGVGGGYPGGYGGGFYPGGGYGGYGGYPGGQFGGQGNNGGGYFGGYPGGYGGYGGYGGGYGGYRPGFGGGLYPGFGGFGPYGYGRNSDSKDNAENDDTPLKRAPGKQSASASSPSSSKPGSSAVKFSSN